MKKYILLCVLCFLCGASQAQKIRIKTGIEVLIQQFFCYNCPCLSIEPYDIDRKER